MPFDPNSVKKSGKKPKRDPNSLLEASNFIRTVEKHSGYKVTFLEEIAFKMKFINLKKLKVLAKPFRVSTYSKYLKSLANEN